MPKNFPLFKFKALHNLNRYESMYVYLWICDVDGHPDTHLYTYEYIQEYYKQLLMNFQKRIQALTKQKIKNCAQYLHILIYMFLCNYRYNYTNVIN